MTVSSSTSASSVSNTTPVVHATLDEIALYDVREFQIAGSFIVVKYSSAVPNGTNLSPQRTVTSANGGCVQNVTRCPRSEAVFANASNGFISPADPIAMNITCTLTPWIAERAHSLPSPGWRINA